VEYYQRSLRIFEELDSPRELANTLLNLAAMLDDCLHQPEEARALFARGLAIVRGSNRILEAVCYQGLGNLERGLGNHSQAQAHYRAGLTLLSEIGSHELMAEVLVDLGRSQLAQPDPDGALDSLHQALDLAAPSQANETIFLAHQWLSEACEQKGDFAHALSHFKEYHRLREAAYSAQTELKVKGLLLKAETDKARQEAEIARQEAEIYRLKHEELSRAHQDLQNALSQNKRLLHELQLKTEDLLRQVWEDVLTGIHNRRYLEMRLPEECERARRFGHDLSVVMMDIDDFKAINDRLSHLTGDQVLKAVAHILVSVSRSVDLVVRYGGDEFMLAMIETGPQQATLVCERLREAVEKYTWSTIHPGLSVTLSMGLCSIRNLPPGGDLVAWADAHLYQAKREGKNRIVGV
jgi:diguanylate cyclase (GGDEF)-like protein